MFRENEIGEIILQLDEKEYRILNNEEYRELIIYLTDPNINADMELKVDEGMEQEKKNICNKYKDFIVKYLEKVKEINDEEAH